MLEANQAAGGVPEPRCQRLRDTRILMALTREHLEPAPGEDASDGSSDGSPKGSRVSRVDALLCCEPGVPGRDEWRIDSTRGRRMSCLEALFKRRSGLISQESVAGSPLAEHAQKGVTALPHPPYKQSPE